MPNEIEEIQRLERDLSKKKELLNNKQNTCPHEWTETKYDPEPYRRAIFSHYIPHGSDPEPVYNYVDDKKDRWSRTCLKCGKVEYTDVKRAVKEEPYFR